MGETWKIVKEVLDWFGVALLGTLGYVCSHWDLIVGRAIAFVTLVLLLLKLYRFFFPKKEIKTDYDV